MNRYLGYLALSIFAPLSPATATVIHVLPDGSGDYPTIQEALNHAVAGDIVSLGDGVFFEHDLVLRSQVAMTSDSGDPELTAVDAEALGRCISGTFVTGAPSVTGITFRNGVAAGGGGLMLADQNNVRFYDCIFRDGSAATGGAVALVGASGGHAPQFFGCTFVSNEASSDGGAAWTNGIGYFVECEFRDNSAVRHGGAVYSEKYLNSGMWLRECRFEGNDAGQNGGALCSIGGQEYQWIGNFATQGAFVNNSAARGGALFVDWYDAAYGCTFFGNTASEAGGALYLVDITVSKEFQWFSGNVIAGNRAGLRGGAVVVTGSQGLFEMVNSTLATNDAPEGAHVWSDRTGTWGSLRGNILAFGLNGAAVAGSGTAEASCSDVFGNPGGDYVGPIFGQSGVSGNISKDPSFCDPKSLDFTLAEGSPCLPPLAGPCGFHNGMGALGEGCAATSSVAGEPSEGQVQGSTWGGVKGGFR